uniref:Uncharacterized protein n=1 Tax=Rhizophora mucronata TaxID=61149 RepID=A0A2P2QJU8_RHIMU
MFCMWVWTMKPNS